jgi:hypothetical protein
MPGGKWARERRGKEREKLTVLEGGRVIEIWRANPAQFIKFVIHGASHAGSTSHPLRRSGCMFGDYGFISLRRSGGRSGDGGRRTATRGPGRLRIMIADSCGGVAYILSKARWKRLPTAFGKAARGVTLRVRDFVSATLDRGLVSGGSGLAPPARSGRIRRVAGWPREGKGDKPDYWQCYCFAVIETGRLPMQLYSRSRCFLLAWLPRESFLISHPLRVSGPSVQG